MSHKTIDDKKAHDQDGDDHDTEELLRKAANASKDQYSYTPQKSETKPQQKQKAPVA